MGSNYFSIPSLKAIEQMNKVRPHFDWNLQQILLLLSANCNNISPQSSDLSTRMHYALELVQFGSVPFCNRNTFNDNNKQTNPNVLPNVFKIGSDFQCKCLIGFAIHNYCHLNAVFFYHFVCLFRNRIHILVVQKRIKSFECFAIPMHIWWNIQIKNWFCYILVESTRLTWVSNQISKLIKIPISNKLIFQTGNRFPSLKKNLSQFIFALSTYEIAIRFPVFCSMYRFQNASTHHILTKLFKLSLLQFGNIKNRQPNFDWIRWIPNISDCNRTKFYSQ